MRFSPLSIFEKSDVTLVLHVDIGEGNSRAALVREEKEGIPEMIYTAARNEKITKSTQSKNLAVTLSSIRELLGDLKKFMVEEASTNKRLRVDKIYVILGAPYYLSHTALLKYKEPKGFTVTPDLVSNILHGYRRSADPEYEGHKEVEIGTSPVTVSERLVHTRVNGYHTALPYGKVARTLDISIFKTETASEVVLGIEREIKKHFLSPVTFEPLSLAVYVALRNHVNFDPNFLFIVVGNEVTEVSLVRGFTLLETVSFPFGKHSLIRRLSRELKSPEEIVGSMLRLYSGNELHQEELSKVNAALGGSAEKWFPFFENSLITLSDKTTVPQSVYLVADPEVTNIFKTFIETDSFASQSMVPTGFAVKPIDTEKAKSIMRFSPRASCDTLLCLEGLFAVSTKIPLHNSKL